MHELVDLGHSMTHAAVGLCRDETRTSEHTGISPAEEGWAAANDNEMYLVAALTCNILQQPMASGVWMTMMSMTNHGIVKQSCSNIRQQGGRLQTILILHRSMIHAQSHVFNIFRF
jgi:hypothetical protein